MVFKSFSFDLENSRKITTDIIFRPKITEFRSKSPKFRSEFIGISFFEFEVPFRSELANFGEISTEISFPANGGIRKKNEKVNPGHKSPAPAVANWVGTAAPQDYRRRPSRHLLHCACAVGEVAAATESLKAGTRLHFRLNYFPPKFAMKN